MRESVIMGIRDFAFIGLLASGIVMLGINLVPSLKLPNPHQQINSTSHDPELLQSVQELNAIFQSQWSSNQLHVTKHAPDLAITRRLSLALTGTTPSLEEIRQFEKVPEGQRINWWLEHLLEDRRFADYYAERFARAFVGTEDGPFLLFRRRRFVNWLTEEIHRNRPYDAIVRELISGKGIWTDKPSTNFISVTSQPEMKNQPNPVRLASRVTRVFLGLRLDCAQ